MAALSAGDALVVTTGDRLAHSVDALLAIEARMHKRGIGLILLAFNGALVDFRTDGARPVLDLLNEIARWEYHGLRERQLAGIARARQGGRYRGRRAVIPAEDVRRRLEAGVRPSVVARDLGVARSSVYRVAAGAGGSPFPVLSIFPKRRGWYRPPVRHDGTRNVGKADRDRGVEAVEAVRQPGPEAFLVRLREGDHLHRVHRLPLPDAGQN